MTLKQKTRNLIRNTNRFSGKLFAYTIQSLIIISLITFSIDTLPGLSQQTKDILNWIKQKLHIRRSTKSILISV